MSGYGFAGGETVVVTGPVARCLRSFSTGSGGSFTRTLTIPADAPAGAYLLTATGQSSGATGEVTFTVVVPPPAPANSV